jgi:hypothetical protein
MTGFGDYQEDDRGWSDHDDEDRFPADQEGGSLGCSHADDQGADSKTEEGVADLEEET